MNIVNTLDFLKKTKSLHALDFATCYEDLSIFYNFIRDDEQFIQNVNFGIVYGISSFGVGQDLNITRKEADNYIKSY